MIVVSNAFPLILLAKADCLHLLPETFRRIYIATDVYREVAERDASRPAAIAVRDASWIEVRNFTDANHFAKLRQQHRLGAGELATIQLARELSATFAIIDERSARRVAIQHQVKVIGCIGVLEIAQRQGTVGDLRQVYQRLVAEGMYIDRAILDRSLGSFGLPRL